MHDLHNQQPPPDFHAHGRGTRTRSLKFEITRTRGVLQKRANECVEVLRACAIATSIQAPARDYFLQNQRKNGNSDRIFCSLHKAVFQGNAKNEVGSTVAFQGGIEVGFARKTITTFRKAAFNLNYTTTRFLF